MTGRDQFKQAEWRQSAWQACRPNVLLAPDLHPGQCGAFGCQLVNGMRGEIFEEPGDEKLLADPDPGAPSLCTHRSCPVGRNEFLPSGVTDNLPGDRRLWDRSSYPEAIPKSLHGAILPDQKLLPAGKSSPGPDRCSTRVSITSWTSTLAWKSGAHEFDQLARGCISLIDSDYQLLDSPECVTQACRITLGL